MAAGVNLLKLFDADFGVNRRRVEFFVSKQLLDEPDVGPVLQHVRGAGVPQDRWHEPRVQPGTFFSQAATMRLTTSGLKSSP